MAAVALATNAVPRRLRIGLFADARLQPRWVVEAFDKLAHADFAEITLIAIAQGAAKGTALVQSLYGRFDRWAFGEDPSAEPHDLVASLPHRRLVSLEYPFNDENLD